MTREARFQKELVAALASVRDEKEMKILLKALLTPAEYKEIATRLQIFKQLDAGVSQRTIAKDLGIGIATVTRGSRALNESEGWLSKMFS